MPKYQYNKYYGALTMTPFVASWISLFVAPFLACIKDKETLQ